jgi:urocanate hydratase
VAHSSAEADPPLEQVLANDPAMSVIRYADAG